MDGRRKSSSASKVCWREYSPIKEQEYGTRKTEYKERIASSDCEILQRLFYTNGVRVYPFFGHDGGRSQEVFGRN